VKHACRWLALAFACAGEPERAHEQLALGIDATRAQPVPLVDWRCQALLGQLARRTGKTAEAERAREAAQSGIDAIARCIDDQAERRCFERMVREAPHDLDAVPGGACVLECSNRALPLA
jgi:hypothetical protein